MYLRANLASIQPRTSPVKLPALCVQIPQVFPAVFGAADDKGLVLYLFAFYYFTCLLVNWYFYYEGLMRPGKGPRAETGSGAPRPC